MKSGHYIEMLWKRKIIIISFYLSLLLPAYCLSNARCFYEQLKNVYSQDLEQGKGLLYYGETISLQQRKEIEQIETDNVAYEFRRDEIIPGISVEKDTTIKGCGGAIFSFYGKSMLKGRFFNANELFEGKPVCVISDSVANAASLEINDKIRMYQTSFRIIGISREFGRNIMYVPYEMYPLIYPDQFMQQEILINENIDAKVKEQISVRFQEILKGKEVTERNLTEGKKESRLFVKKMIWSRVAGGIGVSVFSIINIFVLLLGMMNRKKEQYAIRRAVGAKKVDVYFLFMKECIHDMCMAMVLLIVTFQSIIKYMNLAQEITYDLVSILGIAGISVAFCFILSILLTHNFMKQPIYLLLQKEGE